MRPPGSTKIFNVALLCGKSLPTPGLAGFWSDCNIVALTYKGYNFYRAMHFSAYARSWDRMSSVRLSVRL